MGKHTDFNSTSGVTERKVKQKIEIALLTFFKNDQYLVEYNLHEQSMSHRLAIYLDELFPEFNVDSEWNKNKSDEKRIFTSGIISLVESEIESILNIQYQPSKETEEGREKEIRERNIEIGKLKNLKKLLENYGKPRKIKVSDFTGDELLFFKLKDGEYYVKGVRPDIIVHLRGTNNNKIVIEIKKEDKAVSKFSAIKYYDLMKLHAMTTQMHLNYSFGFYIEFPSKDSIWSKVQIKKSKFLEKITGKKTKVFEVTFR